MTGHHPLLPPEMLESDTSLVPEWKTLVSKTKDNAGAGGGTAGGGKPYSGFNNSAWTDPESKAGTWRAEERSKDSDRWGVKGPPLADSHPKNGLLQSSKWREDDRAIPPPLGRPRWEHSSEPRWNDQGMRGQNDIFAPTSAQDPWSVEASALRGRGRASADTNRWNREDRWGALGGDLNTIPRKWGAGPDHGTGGPETGDDRWGNDSGRLARGGRGIGGTGFGTPPFGHGPGFNDDAGRSRSYVSRGRGRGLVGPVTQYDKWHPGSSPVPLSEERAVEPVPRRPTHRYSKRDMVSVFKQMKQRNALGLPDAVDNSDPTLFAGPDQPEVVDVLAGVHQPGPGGDPEYFAALQEAAGKDELHPHDEVIQNVFSVSKEREDPGHAAGALPTAKVEPGLQPPTTASLKKPDEWVYLDPANVLQGPFSKAEIIDWKQSGYFFAELQIRNSADSDFGNLNDLLESWGIEPAPPRPNKSEGERSATPTSSVSVANAIEDALPQSLSPLEPSPLQHAPPATQSVSAVPQPASMLFSAYQPTDAKEHMNTEPPSPLSGWFQGEKTAPLQDQGLPHHGDPFGARVQPDGRYAAGGQPEGFLEGFFRGNGFPQQGDHTQQLVHPSQQQAQHQQPFASQLFPQPSQLQLPQMLQQFRGESGGALPFSPSSHLPSLQGSTFPPGPFQEPQLRSVHGFADPPQHQSTFSFPAPTPSQGLSNAGNRFPAPGHGLPQNNFNVPQHPGNTFGGHGGAHQPFFQQSVYGAPGPSPLGRPSFFDQSSLQRQASSGPQQLPFFAQQQAQQQPPLPHHHQASSGTPNPLQTDPMLGGLGLGGAPPSTAPDLRQPFDGSWNPMAGGLFPASVSNIASQAPAPPFPPSQAPTGHMSEVDALPAALLEDTPAGQIHEEPDVRPSPLPSWVQGNPETLRPPTDASVGPLRESSQPWHGVTSVENQGVLFNLPREPHPGKAPDTGGFPERNRPTDPPPAPAVQMRQEMSFPGRLADFFLPKEVPQGAVSASPPQHALQEPPNAEHEQDFLFPVKGPIVASPPPLPEPTPSPTDEPAPFQKVQKKSRKPSLLKDEPASVLPDDVPPPRYVPAVPQGKIQVVDTDPRLVQEHVEAPRQIFQDPAGPAPLAEAKTSQAWAVPAQAKPVVKTLAEIQEEEARAAAAAEAVLESGVATSGGTWAKTVGKFAGGPAWGSPFEYQEHDMRQRSGREVLGALGEALAPQGITIGDALGLRQPEPAAAPIKLAPWAASAGQKAVPVTNLRDIQFAAEQVARQEQRKPTDRGASAPPPRVVAAPTPAPAPAPILPEPPKQPGKTAKEVNEEQKRMIAQMKAEINAPKRDPSKTVQPIVAQRVPPPKFPPQEPQFPAPETDDDLLFWDYGQGSVGRGVNLVQSAAANRLPAKPPQPNGSASFFSQPAINGQAPVAQAGGREEPNNAVPVEELEFGVRLSSDFRTWCRTQLRKLRGDDDLTLVYICMTLSANSEVAETIQQAITAPGVHQFIAEFMRRRALETGASEKKGGKSRKAAVAESSKPATATAKVEAPVYIEKKEASGWNRIQVKGKGKGKGKKGEKVPGDFLGFESGLNYNLLSNQDV
eukprot:jgi/Botrbrau1/10231/Bobra.0362s0020.1